MRVSKIKFFNTITVVVYPWAGVSVDGKPLGSTPLVAYSLPVGRHVLRLTNHELGRDETVSLAVSAGKTLKIRRNWLR